VKHRAGEVVAAFLEVAHALDLAAVGLVVDVREDVQRLEDPPVVRERVTQLCGRAAGREDPEDVVGWDGAGVTRSDDVSQRTRGERPRRRWHHACFRAKQEGASRRTRLLDDELAMRTVTTVGGRAMAANCS
jgi:hypothetical protein